MLNRIIETLGYILLVVEAAAIAFLMSAWIRGGRNADG